MSDTVELNDKVAQGENWTPVVTVRDSTGTIVDLSDVTITLVLRLKRGSDTVVTRTMGASNETSFPASGTDGRIQFLFSPTETLALTAGRYVIELVYGDTDSTPDTKRICGRGTLVVYAPVTGTI